MPKIYIAGAHSRAQTIGHYLQYLNQDIIIENYLFDNDEENPNEINGVAVLKIDETSRLDVELPVYLGMRGVNQNHMRELLSGLGMKHIIPVDVQLDLELRNRFLAKYFSSIGRHFSKIEEYFVGQMCNCEGRKKACVYVAASAFDKPLEASYTLQDYEKIIQVGAALTDKRILAGCYDNEGENISDKNRQFCELTGLYWIWKHATEDIVGLVHYRRHFMLPSDWKERMLCHNIDVILPLPLYVSPSIDGNYRNRHVASNWDYMLEYLRDADAKDYESALEFFQGTALYSPCNMFIMKREVLDDLCSWLFPILMAVAEHGGVLADSYQNRYPGFISERLITYFFEKNRDKYNVVYADKNFLS